MDKVLTDEELKRLAALVTEQVAQRKEEHERDGEADPLTEEAIKQLIDEQVKATTEAQLQAFAADLRKGKSETEDQERDIDRLDPEQKRDLDHLYIGHILCTDTQWKSNALRGKKLSETQMFEKIMKRSPELKRALSKSGGAGSGADWIPTGFSDQLYEDLQLQLKVAALHEWFDMPTDPYKFPYKYSHATAYKKTEGSAVSSTSPTTTSLEFSTTAVGVKTEFTDEIDEDSIIAIAPLLRRDILQAMGIGLETMIINGDTAAPNHMDSDTVAAADVRKIWEGWRKHVLTAAKVDAGNAAPTLAKMRAVKTKMGRYGLQLGNLAWVTGIIGYNKLIDLDEVKTLDKFGPNATVLKGQMAELDGIPIIVSEYMREDTNASGVFDNVTKDRALVMLVYRPGFLIGRRRDITLETDREIDKGNNIMVATARWEFEDVQRGATNPIVGLLYNIATV